MNICRDCGNPTVENRVRCRACLDRHSRIQKVYQIRNRQNGICIDCGNPRDGKSIVYCEKCRENRKQRAAKRYIKNRLNAVCTNCGRPRGSGKLCPTCIESAKSTKTKTYLASNFFKARERDGFACRICGRTEKLHVHHIDGHGERDINGKRQTPNNAIENLITLCGGCHSSITKFRNLGKDTQLIISLITAPKL